jgi:cardiolipin synthase
VAGPPRRYRTGRRVVRTVTEVGRSLGAAVSGNRPLEDFEVVPVVAAGLLLGAMAIVGFIAPRVLAWPVAVLAAWMAATFLVDAWSIRRRDRR